MEGKIPVSFHFKGKQYSGILEPVHGAGARVWHLTVDRYYWGRLRMLEAERWAFDGNKPGLEDLAEEFGNQVMLWHQ